MGRLSGLETVGSRGFIEGELCDQVAVHVLNCLPGKAAVTEVWDIDRTLSASDDVVPRIGLTREAKAGTPHFDACRLHREA